MAAALDDDKLLEILFRGNSRATQKVRAQIRSISSNISARGAIIIGPVGAGKSTIARVIALMRYLQLCADETRKRIVQHLAFDGPFRIDKRYLNWFEEVNLTGLTDGLAQAQLFGVAKGAATNVLERPGIFEQAMNGHFDKDHRSDAARVTGGVVLLDEIGDFSPGLQPLLLSLLTGAEVFRVGGEGNPKYGYSYKGVTIAATWKDPFDGTLRYDLLSRLANYVIRIPGLNDREDEFEEIVNAMMDNIRSRHVGYLDELDRERPDVVSRAKIKYERGRELKLDQANIELLKKLDWSKRGDLRGLRQILERCFYEGVSVREAAETSAIMEMARPGPGGDIARDVIEEICRGNYPTTLTREMKRIEKRVRTRVASILEAEPGLKKRVTDRLEINDQVFRKQLNDLTRDRARDRDETY